MRINWWIVGFLALLFYLFYKKTEKERTEVKERQKEITRGV